MIPRRRIALPHLNNLRDLGGYEAGEGRAVLWGRVFRSDCPALANADEWEALRGLGVTTLVDLRSSAERFSKPVDAPEGMAYHHCPLLGERGSAATEADASREYMKSMSLDYAEMMERSIDGVVRVLQVVLAAVRDGGSVDFFCTAGKDRTGMIAATILCLCGVCDDDIVADYCLTEVYNAESIARQIAAMPDEVKRRLPPGRIELASASKPQTMRDFLAWAHERDLAELLCAHGFARAEQDELGRLLTQDPRLTVL